MIRVTRRQKCLVGAVAAKDNPDLAPQFRLPRPGASNQVFLTVARGMLEKASAQKDVLVPFQLFGTSHRIPITGSAVGGTDSLAPGLPPTRDRLRVDRRRRPSTRGRISSHVCD